MLYYNNISFILLDFIEGEEGNEVVRSDGEAPAEEKPRGQRRFRPRGRGRFGGYGGGGGGGGRPRPRRDSAGGGGGDGEGVVESSGEENGRGGGQPRGPRRFFRRNFRGGRGASGGGTRRPRSDNEGGPQENGEDGVNQAQRGPPRRGRNPRFRRTPRGKLNGGNTNGVEQVF